MQWVTCRYACAFRRQTDTLGNGHVFQRRFWNAPARDEQAFLANLRYIEANPVRAALVCEADLWPWSSCTERGRASRAILAALPVELPRTWTNLINRPLPAETVERIRKEMKPAAGRPRKSRK
jgi:hypothetical protein